MSDTAISKYAEGNTKIVGSKYYTHVLPRPEEVYKRLCDIRKGADIQCQEDILDHINQIHY